MIYGLTRIERPSPKEIAPEIAIIAAAFSVLLSLILLVIFYKFNSHNRFAGFCKLLNHERHEPISDQIKIDKESSLFSWEVTVGDLRIFERIEPEEELKIIIDELKINKPANIKLLDKVKKCLGTKPDIDVHKRRKGFCIMLDTFFLQDIKTDSWGFPPLVVNIFFFLSFGFLIASYFVTYRNGVFSNLIIFNFQASITVFHLFLWRHLSGKLFSLMNGSTTVYSFFWKFIPLRTLFLNDSNIRPSYISVEDLLTESEKDKECGSYRKIVQLCDAVASLYSRLISKLHAFKS